MPTRSSHPSSGAAPKRRRRTRAEIDRAAAKKLAARKYHLNKTHRMSLEIYEMIKAFQDGRCPGCLTAQGISRALAVDHEHYRAGCEHDHKTSCEECWRGLLCGTCNDVLAHCRDSIPMLERFIEYIRNPPAQKWRRANGYGQA